MLVQLRIVNFAVIKEQTISFAPGLNVISGETGAGKSIILNALKLVLGSRANADLIRAEEESLTVEALFDLRALPEDLVRTLPDKIQGCEEVLLSRELSIQGKNRVYINGSLGSVALLKEISARLIQLCGQSQQIRLLDTDYQLDLLDQYAGLEQQRKKYGESFTLWNECRETLRVLELQLSESRERALYFATVVEDLEPHEIQGGVRLGLEGEIRQAKESEQFARVLSNMGSILNSDQGPLAAVAELRRELKRLRREGVELQELEGLLDDAQSVLQEVESKVVQFSEGSDVDHMEIEKKRERLAEIARLERKYRLNDAGLEALLAEAREELARLKDDGQRERLGQRQEMLRAQVDRLAEDLTARRKRAAQKLSKAVRDELEELNMGNTMMTITFEELELPGPSGGERIEFLFAMNPHEEPRPLKGFASGGELSRIMLVLKKLLRDSAGVNVLVFDEVDTGVSGRVARAVGEKLQKLSRDSQVICITHLAQVASLADYHLIVRKDLTESGRINSRVERLKGDQQVDEIARMLAGYDITEAARASARELLASK